jgi:hypothetical protein
MRRACRASKLSSPAAPRSSLGLPPPRSLHKPYPVSESKRHARQSLERTEQQGTPDAGPRRQSEQRPEGSRTPGSQSGQLQCIALDQSMPFTQQKRCRRYLPCAGQKRQRHRHRQPRPHHRCTQHLQRTQHIRNRKTDRKCRGSTCGGGGSRVLIVGGCHARVLR